MIPPPLIRILPIVLAAVVAISPLFPYHAGAQDSEGQPETPDAADTEKMERLKQLERRYQETLAEARAPVIESYLASLNEQKATLIRDGNTEAATLIEAEIAWVNRRPWEKKRPDFERLSRPDLDRIVPMPSMPGTFAPPNIFPRKFPPRRPEPPSRPKDRPAMRPGDAPGRLPIPPNP